MDDEKPLAKFRHPPLIEVVHGVQFAPLPMTIIHPGLFYETVKVMYPQTQTQPPLAPVRENFGGAMSMLWPFAILQQTDLPRAWFVSEDDTMLIQLQNDRLLLNWRCGPQAAEYPHFEHVSAEFQRIYTALEGFAAENGLGPVQPNQCEMTYINHLNVAGGEISPADPGAFLNMWRFEDSDWHLPLEDLAFNIRFLMNNDYGQPIGRLHAALSTVVKPPQDKKILQLELTVRGVSDGEGLEPVVKFHQAAHQQIVRCFTAITTETAHKKWERYV